MKLSRDPDTLRIPAFMRKKSIAAKLKRPLILTALDRKQAALTTKRKLRTARAKITPLIPTKIPKKKTAQPKAAQPKTTPSFSAPLMEFFEAPPAAARPKKSRSTKENIIGTLTHYYAKIKVGVIALKNTLQVGDTISYQTAEGPYEQIVESMEIDRQPVFKAGKGKEIGLKLRREPKIGSDVLSPKF